MMLRHGLTASVIAVLLAFFLAVPTDGYYLPGSYPNVYAWNSTLLVKVNSVTSSSTELPFPYYSFPFCKPDGHVKRAAENLGELLMGDRIESSPYRFHMQVPESSVHLCAPGQEMPLTKREARYLTEKIREGYRVNMILDSLPVTTAPLDEDFGDISTGFPVGFEAEGMQFINNHLLFKILAHQVSIQHGTATGFKAALFPATTAAEVGGGGTRRLLQSTSPEQDAQPSGDATPYEDAPPALPSVGFMVVGFEVLPCSVARNPEDASVPRYGHLQPVECGSVAPQQVKEGETVVFTYDVMWEASDTAWVSRWDAYLKMDGEQVHWFSIFNSIMVITFLSGVVFLIMLKTVRKDLAVYEEEAALTATERAEESREDSGWKLLVGDVFRAPPHGMLLCSLVGSGVQVFAMFVITVFFAALGFMSPASRGTLLSFMVVLFLLMSLCGSYTGTYLWIMMSQTKASWVSVPWRVAIMFPGLVFVTTAIINGAIRFTGSSGAIPFTVFISLIILWFLISVPLAFWGGLAASKKPIPSYPVRTNQIPRQVPDQRIPPLLLVIGTGIVPFGTVFIELYFIMTSLWLHRVYYVFGFLLVVTALLVIVCAEVSVVLTYVHLCMEDYRWWWRSFLGTGSTALYTLIYAIGYLIFDLDNLAGSPVSIFLYLGYMGLIVIAVLLATGAIGFLSSLYFNWLIFSSVKLD